MPKHNYQYEPTQIAWPVQAPATSVAMVPAVSVSLSSSELQMLATYAAKVERWGWRWRLCGPDSTSFLLTHFGSVLAATMNAFDLQVILAYAQLPGENCLTGCLVDFCHLLPPVGLDATAFQASL